MKTHPLPIALTQLQQHVPSTIYIQQGITTQSTINYNYSIPQDGILPSDHLTWFLPAWKRITHHTWPISVIKSGYQRQFTRIPSPWRIKPMKRFMEDQLVDELASKQFLKAGIIRVSPTQNKDYSSNFIMQETSKR